MKNEDKPNCIFIGTCPYYKSESSYGSAAIRCANEKCPNVYLKKDKREEGHTNEFVIERGRDHKRYSKKQQKKKRKSRKK